MTEYNPFDPHFDKVVEEKLAKWHIPSISFAVVDKTSSHFKSYGVTNLDRPIDADKDTLYYGASTTKAQVCAAWGLYINSSANQSKSPSERITWRTRIVDIIGSDFDLSDPSRAQAITLEDAVSHRTGMPRHDLIRGFSPENTAWETISRMSHLPFHNGLRMDFEYCNLMYVVAGCALEKVTGKSLAAVLRSSLWEPLGMDATYAGLPEAEKAIKDEGRVLATSYIWSKAPEDPKEARCLVGQPHVDLTCAAAAGYVISTATDYAKWMQALVGSNSTLLSRDLTKELWTPRIIVHATARKVPLTGVVGYALGWFAGEYRGHMVYWHSGGAAGAGSFVLIVPELQWGVTFFANGHDVSSSIKGLAFELLEARLGVPESERTALQTCEESYKTTLRTQREEYENGLERLFPGYALDPSPKRAKSIEQYEGKYRHPNYGEITVHSAKDGKSGQSYLCSTLDDRTIYTVLHFQPVVSTASSPHDEEWFLVTLYDQGDTTRLAVQARGRRNSHGEVEGLDIAFESAMPTTFLPFERVSALLANGVGKNGEFVYDR